jgi:predicted secreted protein
MGVAFVAHCLLNQNSKVLDGAHCAGVYSRSSTCCVSGAGGSSRCPAPSSPSPGWAGSGRCGEQYDTAAFRRHCQRLATAVAGAIEARVQQGEEIVLVGVEGSPSMGVTITSSDPRAVAGRPGRTARPS